MKKRLLTFILLFLGIGLTPMHLSAQSAEDAPTEPENMIFRTQSVTPGGPGETSDIDADMRQRIFDRIATHGQPESSVALRIADNCNSAQGKIESLKGRINGLKTSRGEVYGGFTDRLNTLNQTLKAEGVDTQELESAISSLQAKIDTFNTALETHQLSVSDMADMDCKADAFGFHATLMEARTTQSDLRDHTGDIHNFLRNDIKTVLESLKTQLNQKGSE